MSRVVCFGEALIDFLNTGKQLDGELMLNSFTQYPGGAPANAAVAVARLGGRAAFAGQVGDDAFGHFLLRALKRYGVDTAHVAVHPTAPTPLAFVFLDAEGERSFTFRRDGTADIVLEAAQVSDAWFADTGIAHFCSNTMTDAHCAAVTAHFVSRAKAHGAVVSFDVNLRHNLWPGNAVDVDTVNALVYKADLVKFAREELDHLSQSDEDGYLARCFEHGVIAALVTDGPNPLEIRTATASTTVVPPTVTAVDTTGGGDAFIGAVLFGLSQDAKPAVYLADEDRLSRLVSAASHCGALAVTRRGAFPSFPTFADVAGIWDAS